MEKVSLTKIMEDLAYYCATNGIGSDPNPRIVVFLPKSVLEIFNSEYVLSEKIELANSTSPSTLRAMHCTAGVIELKCNEDLNV